MRERKEIQKMLWNVNLVFRNAQELWAKSGHLTAGPRLHEVELNNASNPLKIPFVVGHENTAGFSAREREQDIIRERFRDAGNFQSVLSRHFCEQISGSVPGIGRRCDCSIRSLKDFEDVPFQRLPVSGPAHTSPQFLGDDHTEMLKRRKGAMEPLEFLVDHRIAKGVDEELSIENVLARASSHRSASGGVISIPSIARVPSMSSRWKTARSSARSMVSVAVAAPSARLAARNFDSGSR
jgi:hypothetical protein